MSDRIDALKPRVREMAHRMLSRLDAAGVKYHVHETWRSKDTQAAYFAQGRDPLLVVNARRSRAGLPPITEGENRATVTGCDGETKVSRHQSGEAMDVYPVVSDRVMWAVSGSTAELWRRIGEAGEAEGFRWGGRWQPLDRYGLGWDCPHFEAREEA